MTRKQYEMEKAAIMAEYIKEKQAVVDECDSRVATVEKIFRDAEDGYSAAGRRYRDSSIEVKDWYEHELAALKERVLREEAESGGGFYEIQSIRNRHTERVTELIEKKNEKIEKIEIELCGAKMRHATAVRNWRIDLNDLAVIRRKAIDEIKNMMYEKLKALAAKMQEEGGAE